MKKIFVTSTGTAIGKTLFTCSLIKHLKFQGKQVKALKPIISGFKVDSVPNDISQMLDALQLEYNSETIQQISKYQFEKPLSPDQAAKFENIEIDYNKLKEFCSQQFDCEYLIIEGAGGIHVPLSNTKTIMDLIKDLAIDSIILVSGSYLGSLSHTISAVKNFESLGLRIDHLIMTENLDETDENYIPAKQNIESLKNFYSGNIVEITHKKDSLGNISEEIKNIISKEFTSEF